MIQPYLRIVLAAATFIVTAQGFGSSHTRQLNAREISNSSKAGLAWPNGRYDNIRQFEYPKISWYYTWFVWPISSRNDLDFVPMLWGKTSLNDFTSNIKHNLEDVKPTITAVLGMNEPEISGQANMPAPAGGPIGKAWLEDFFTACNGSCNPDFIATHWYGVDADAFVGYLQDLHKTFNKPIWITEWACQNFVDTAKQCSADQVVSFMNKTQTFMDNATFVERHAWFGAMRNLQGVNPFNALMDERGRITDLGRQYTGAAGGAALTNDSSISRSIGLLQGSPSMVISCIFLILIGMQSILFF